MLDVERSSPLDRASPSTLRMLETCHLQVALSRQATGSAAAWNAHAAVGDACHRILALLVASHALEADGWQTALEDAWGGQARAMTEQALSHGIATPPERWPGVELTRARLRVVARRVRDLLHDAGPGAEALTELSLRSADGLLGGRIDLVVAGPRRHAVVDYKTGATVDPLSGRIREDYEAQLEIYAYLEAERSGSWPSEALLLPFNGPPVSITVDSSACGERAKTARALLAQYNRIAPGPQPASPTPGGCAICAYAVACDAFWAAADASWAPQTVAVEGRLAQVTPSELGTINMRILVKRGSGQLGACLIRAVRPQEHPGARSAAIGNRVRATGLRAEPDRGSYALPAWGHLAVLADTPPPTALVTA